MTRSPAQSPVAPTTPPSGIEGQAGAAHIVGELEAAHVRNVLSKCVLPIHLARREEVGGSPRPSGLLRALPPWALPPPTCPFPEGLGRTPPLCAPRAWESVRTHSLAQVSVHADPGGCARSSALGLCRHVSVHGGVHTPSLRWPGLRGPGGSEGASPAGCRR